MRRQLKNLRRRSLRHPNPEATLRRWLSLATAVNHDEGWADIGHADWRTITASAPDLPPLIPRPANLPGEIWGVTCHFNPAGFAIKKQVYDRFRAATKAQGLKLLAVELSPSGVFELSDLPGDDAEIVIRLTEGDPLWQKERLLNVGIAALPPEADKIIWIDADLVFDNPRWVAQTAAVLGQYPIVQCFRDCIRLGEHTDLPRIMQDKAKVRPGMGEERRQLGFVAAMRHPQRPGRFVGHPGFVWAARRSLLEKHGLYDANVIGCGDAVMAHAINRQMYTTEDMRSPAYEAHARAWMQRFAADVQHSAAFIEGTVYHLWHGDARHRGYGNRTQRFGKTAFDPQRDLKLTSQGTWAWTGTVSATTRRTVARYFRSRREDGGPVVFPTWLLAHPRCGSNWLCSLLNATGAFDPQLVEWHNPDCETKWGLARPPGYPFPRNVKFQPAHHRGGGLDLAEVVRRMPDTAFVMVRRRDLIAAAASLYIVRETGGTWTLMTQDERRTWLDKQVVIDDARLLAAHRELLRDVRHWPRVLKAAGITPTMTVYYEDLLADTPGTLEALCKLLSPGGDITPVVRTDATTPIRQVRPESEAVYERLRELLGRRTP